tara:strand:- start:1028 stop:1759 length:732 start_codon:yes stop_codon:yes gene_type:complete
MDVLNNPKFSYLIKKQPFYYKIFKTLFYYYSKTVFTIYTPVTVQGQENIPDDSFIACSNHNSHLDVALLSVSTRKTYNQMAMLAAKDYFFDSWIRRISINMVMNLIPIDRKVNGVRKFSIENTLSLCRAFMNFEKRNLIMFPEGTRGKPGEVLPFHLGTARFSIHLNKPILPAVIYGSHLVWPRGKIFFGWPKKIKVIILKPIYPDRFLKEKNPNKEDIQKATKKMTEYLENQIKEKTKFLYG